MSSSDREHWDAKHARSGGASLADIRLPAVFAPFESEFPTAGFALEVACGRGEAGVWLAQRGLDVLAVDVSPVAVDSARELAHLAGVVERCRFEVADLDAGIPAGPPVEVLLCHLFRDPRLDDAMVERLAPGGLLAMVCLSEVDAEPGAYRAGPGELPERFARLDLIAAGEGGGRAWLLGRRSFGA